MNIASYTEQALTLLKQLIAIPSLSKEEESAAHLMEASLMAHGCKVKRKGHNVWATSTLWDVNKPTLLLNSHIDTVKPSSKWTKDPFSPLEEEGRIYGLGSNDAGGPLVCLYATFLYLNTQSLSYNLIFAATAEEEISGVNGIASILEELGDIDLAIVGEPTQMQMAIAEKGLMVIDGLATGKAGHAARHEGENALYKAIADIQWLQHYTFPNISPLLGPVKATVTMINAGTQHNVIPDTCTFVIDVRSNECYTNKEIAAILQAHMTSVLTPRSYRLNSSGISENHPIVQQGIALGLSTYASPTLSDQALMPFPSIKIGPGDSARSHTADEYIYIQEIQQGIETYIKLLLDLSW